MANYEIKKITKEKKKKQVAAELYRQLRAADRREMKAIVKERGTMEDEVYESCVRRSAMQRMTVRGLLPCGDMAR